MEHDLKLSTRYFDLVDAGIKTFECRVNDRDFQVGDILNLKEWVESPWDVYTGNEIKVEVTYVLHVSFNSNKLNFDSDAKGDFVIMSIKKKKDENGEALASVFKKVREITSKCNNYCSDEAHSGWFLGIKELVDNNSVIIEKFIEREGRA